MYVYSLQGEGRWGSRWVTPRTFSVPVPRKQGVGGWARKRYKVAKGDNNVYGRVQNRWNKVEGIGKKVRKVRLSLPAYKKSHTTCVM